MNKMLDRNVDPEYKIAVDIDTLCGLLSCGRPTAAKIGEEAEARIRIGRRVLYCVEKIKQYVELMSF